MRKRRLRIPISDAGAVGKPPLRFIENMHNLTAKHPAILLIGPTGSGKTPLGELLEEKGFEGRRCLHFDFGANLRKIADPNSAADILRKEDFDVIRSVLRSGALLEDQQFHIAEKILFWFIAEKNAGPDDFIVLNGLPRHIGQAKMIDSLIKIDRVIFLNCSPEVVFERIRTNAGDDRGGRVDDSLAEIENKLRIFSERTSALVEHYRCEGAKIIQIDVDAAMRAEEIWAKLDRM